MEIQEIHTLIQRQREYFASAATLDVSHRLQALKKLKEAIIRRQQEIHDALYMDLGKSAVEGYMSETGMVLSELNYMLRHTRRLAARKTVWTPLAQFPSHSYRLPCPYGVVLVMSPWNYPFMLTMEPLIDALAAGNCVCVKPSAYSPATSRIIESLIHEVFEAEYVSVIQGGRQENQALLDEPFDYIFFTGSCAVGHEVMRKASVHLTPVTLELGGKSPCIVDESADLDVAARRIVFGKFLNLGQTCVAPDYLYVQQSVKQPLLEAIGREIHRQFADLSHYGKIINDKHFQRLQKLIDPDKVVYGGQILESTRQILPTVMDQVSWEDPVMQEEIFGPILPVLTYENLQDCLDQIRLRPSPLALYFFSRRKDAIRKVQREATYGGGCINDTIIHLATTAMPFGGVGNSGMGGYHGKVGFETFSHIKSIVDKKTWLDLPIRYQPYTPLKDKLIRMFMR